MKYIKIETKYTYSALQTVFNKKDVSSSIE